MKGMFSGCGSMHTEYHGPRSKKQVTYAERNQRKQEWACRKNGINPEVTVRWLNQDEAVSE